jgi:hypothetical protein
VGARLAGIDLQRRADQLDGARRIAALAFDHPAQVQGVELLRVERQHLGIQRLRLPPAVPAGAGRRPGGAGRAFQHMANPISSS